MHTRELKMDKQTEKLASDLIQKIKIYLLANMGRVLVEANDEEVYRALVHVIREEIMLNYLASEATFKDNKVRKLYYLSMEYLPGRFLLNNLSNMQSLDLVQCALQMMNRNLANIISKENEPGLGSGGLGRLASCFLDSLATLHYPARGYGLRYQYGLFEQQLRDGIQIEAPDCWLINENPWELRREKEKNTVKYGGTITNATNFHGDPVQVLHNFEEVWAMPYDIPILGYKAHTTFTVLTLRLWSTKESPRNFQLQSYNAGKIDHAAENMLISDVLYPNELNETGKRIRLKQEFLLVSASIQDIIQNYLASYDSFHEFSDKIRIQINDTHPALLIAELIRTLNKDHNIPWAMAVEITRNVTGYTNHTVLKEALEEWDISLMKLLLPRQYKIIEILNHDFCNMVRNSNSNEDLIKRLSIIENGRVRMANLSIIGSHKINGVSKIHSDILKSSLFKDFYDIWPDRFVNVTNGVSHRFWLLRSNPDLADFITSRIGKGWITDFSNIKDLANFASDPKSQLEFLEIRKKNKNRLIHYLSHVKKHTDSGKSIKAPLLIDNESIFFVQIKRFHEYKRQLMNILHLMMVYHDIVNNPTDHKRIKRTCIFAGKSSAGYETAKDIIRLLFSVAKKINSNREVKKIIQVVFIENYNVSSAQMIIPAADISNQISTAGFEASGTSIMKLCMNGALTIGTDDGANIEINQEVTDAWWPFRFGLNRNEVTDFRKTGNYHPKNIYESNPKIKFVLDSLKNHSLATNQHEHEAFCRLYSRLLESHEGASSDPYFVLYDLQSYYDVQLKVENYYQNKALFAEYAIHNIASTSKFSSDHTIKQYNDLIWGLEPCPINQIILDKYREKYTQ
jgi:starch phosphorylase